ncbi:MAG: DUF378 domain-containing protein [Patescibacteria group bacterium]
MSGMNWVGWILLVVGGLNWGLVGAFKFNLVDEIFGVESTISTIVYILVGLAALWMICGAFWKKGDGMMNKPMDSKPGM